MDGCLYLDYFDDDYCLCYDTFSCFEYSIPDVLGFVLSVTRNNPHVSISDFLYTVEVSRRSRMSGHIALACDTGR